MSGDERAEEMERWAVALTVPFARMHERLETLVGRPIFTHEFGLAWNALVEEARNEGPERGTPLTVEQVIEPLIDAGKQVFVAKADKS